MTGTESGNSPSSPPDPAAMSGADSQRGFRIVIADDDVLLREGLASLLNGLGFIPVGLAADAPELLELVAREQPDLALVDVRMPPGFATEGLDAARQIQREHPGVAVVVLSAHVEVEDATELLGAGTAVGYLLKGRVTDVDDFADALERVARGGTVIEPALVRELLDVRRRNDPLEELSEREREVLALMAEGLSNSGIAKRLWVTEGTVEKHVHNILAKLGIVAADDVHRRVLAVVRFLERH